MDNKLHNLIRIGIFYDGYYFYKVSNYYKYEHPAKARISISGLHEFIRSEAAKISGADIKQCQIIDAHYFKGRSSARDMGGKVQSERTFEDILMRENIVTHYLPLRLGPNNILHEKGIDVWLALEAYEMAIYKKFDIIVLVVCDGDYVPLVRKLNTLGTHIMLISWDFDYYSENGRIESTRTAQQLIEEVYHPVQMREIIDNPNRDSFARNLFVTGRENYFAAGHTGDNFSVRQAVESKAEAVPEPGNRAESGEDALEEVAEADDALNSVILSVKEGYGFIEDRAVNNVFFHYSNVENADFNDLKPGMRVRYFREEDVEQARLAESPRYKATKVIVIG
ncbi:MAG: NYN domain-containing protein [Spirochaetaceae bacterium]|nr:NYN domain-containing protein [Spirochaetaceae bacterium]